MQPRVPIRVIKLGGSLLELSDLQQRFHAWLGMQTPARNLIVTGGGKAVEAVRELDATHHFNSKFTHWLCVDLMSVMATLASELLGLEQPLSTPGELSDFLNGTLEIPAIACVQPIAYYTPSIARQRNCSLPESWDCTSDSISAWLASALGADQLVLLKSMETEIASTSSLSLDAIRTLADRSAVDSVFPHACQNLKDVRIVNLRKVA